MPTSELAQKILAENEALRADIAAHTTAVQDLTSRLNDTEDKGNHTRWGLYGLTVVVFGTLAAIGAHQVNRVDDKVDENTDVIITVQEYNAGTCEISNKTRADAKKLWDNQNDLIDLLLPRDDTRIPPAVRKKIDRQRTLANKTYAQKDCTKVSNGAQPDPPNGGIK